MIGEVVECLGNKFFEGWDLYDGVDGVFFGIEECLMAKRKGGGGGEDMEKFQGSFVECRVEGDVGKGGGGSDDRSEMAQSFALQRGVANFLENKKEFPGRRPSESKTSEIPPHTTSYLNQPKPKFLTAKKPTPIQTPHPKGQPSTLPNPAPAPTLRRKSSSCTNQSHLTFKSSASHLPKDPPSTSLSALSQLLGLAIQPLHTNTHNTYYNTKR